MTKDEMISKYLDFKYDKIQKEIEKAMMHGEHSIVFGDSLEYEIINRLISDGFEISRDECDCEYDEICVKW